MIGADFPALLETVNAIAVVGLSADPHRPSHDVTRFLVSRGFTCIGVNPRLAGQRVAGAMVVACLADLPLAVDMIDVFRASKHVGAIVDAALSLQVRPRVIWLQLGVVDNAAAARAEAVGLTVVMDRCPKIELSRR